MKDVRRMMWTQRRTEAVESRLLFDGLLSEIICCCVEVVWVSVE